MRLRAWFGFLAERVGVKSRANARSALGPLPVPHVSPEGGRNSGLARSLPALVKDRAERRQCRR